VDQLDLFLSSLQNGETVTLTSTAGYTKTLVLSEIAYRVSIQKKQIHYMDFDLQFSSMRCNESTVQKEALMTVLRPSEGSLLATFATLLNSAPIEKGGLLILDSVNTLQNMLQEKKNRINYVKANHKAAVLITLAQQFAALHSKILITASVERPRPRGILGSEVWAAELSGGRMLRAKSEVLVSIEHQGQDKISKDLKLILRTKSVSNKSNAALKQGQSFGFLVTPLM
jgi:hypothetical protein